MRCELVKIDYELKLQNEFPFMRRNMSIENRRAIHGIYQAWGCQCSAGWYPLIRDLCQEITNRYADYGISIEDIDLIVLQVKEKFATLRFYYSFKGVSCELQAIDFLAGSSLRFEPHKDEDNDSTKKLRHDISKIVRSYEKKSGSVCEVCGKEGTIRRDMPWKRTLCDECYGTDLSKREEKHKL